LHHRSDDFRRILEVGIDDDHAGTASVVDPGGDRNLVAEVA
jgi:hypothetical protein